MSGRGDGDELFSGIHATRSSLLEILALAVVLALSVNLCSSAIYDAYGLTFSLILGTALMLFSVAYIAFKKLRSRTVVQNISSVFITRRTADMPMIAIGEYWFSEELARVSRAIFEENVALRQQWQNDSIANIWKLHRSAEVKSKATNQTVAVGGKKQGFSITRHEAEPQETAGKRLLVEMVEYLLLEKLQNCLSSYFNKPGFDADMLTELSRADVPSVLMRNRVLDTISRDIADRPAFMGAGGRKEGEVAIYFGDFLYSDFRLRLPRGSEVFREADGRLVIKSDSVTVSFLVNFRGVTANLPNSFPEFYLKYLLSDIAAWCVEIDVTVKVSSKLVAYGKKVAYHAWADSFMKDVKKLNFDVFLDQISWASTRATVWSLIVQRRDAKRSPETATDSERNAKDSVSDADS